MEKCINHYFRPSMCLHIEGVGDCTKCQPDVNNKNCKNYQPVQITIHHIDCTVAKNNKKTTQD